MGTVSVIRGNLFESSAQTLVNTVNCVGVMGKGVALGFKERFPDMFKEYTRRCSRGGVRLGVPYLWKPLVPPYVLNFPTKDHWRSVAKLHDIISGLDFIGEHYKEWGIESLAVPPLGCGEGQLDWQVVGPVLFRKLNEFDIDVELYAPFTATDGDSDPEFLGGEAAIHATDGPHGLNPAVVALAIIVRWVEREPYHWPIGRVTFQKLAYFATAEGIPTGLDFQKASYGPFAKDLKLLQTKLVNNGLLVEQRNGRMFELRTGPTYKDAVEHHKEQLEELRPAIERVADLLLRTDTRRLPILATTHFVSNSIGTKPDSLPTACEVVDEVRRWKPDLEENEVTEAVLTLCVLDWISVDPSSDFFDELEFAEQVA